MAESAVAPVPATSTNGTSAADSATATMTLPVRSSHPVATDPPAPAAAARSSPVSADSSDSSPSTNTTTSTAAAAAAPAPFVPAPTIAALPKTWRFTSTLPPDAAFPTPLSSHRTPRDQISPRTVRGAMFTWVRPSPVRDPELLATSPAALRDLGLRRDAPTTDRDFVATVAGNVLPGWDSDKLEGEGYPWAQCYGGFQFGQWAGQLGDGRAISLFETTNPQTGERYEVQLKGAGLTPYSRFADGRAVLRSSIREFVVSESLHALGIPTTRALSLVLLPRVRVRREQLEPGAITTRFAQTWLRLGNFDLLRSRGDRPLLRRLADYVAEDVFGGWHTLPGRLDDPDDPGKDGGAVIPEPPRRAVPMDELEPAGEEPEGVAKENRYARLYREVVRRNAVTVAAWQAYGFMNGVLNTDNTSIAGLSIDFGPFAFIDNFDPAYTPNHDDHFLRYSYRNQPTVVWWNLVRLGEALGELMGAGPDVDDARFVDDGVTEEQAPAVIARAERLIEQAGEEYKAVFLAEYRRRMTARLGLRHYRDEDFSALFSSLLDTMEALELDFNLFFRRLGRLDLADLATDDARARAARVFFTEEPADPARRRVAAWLAVWRRRVLEDWRPEAAKKEEDSNSSEDAAAAADLDSGVLAPEVEAARKAAMKAVNPSFLPRGWILDELIRRVEKYGERDVLKRVVTMATHPFEDSWHGRVLDGEKFAGDAAEEARWAGDVPKAERALQCSCSS